MLLKNIGTACYGVLGALAVGQASVLAMDIGITCYNWSLRDDSVWRINNKRLLVDFARQLGWCIGFCMAGNLYASHLKSRRIVKMENVVLRTLQGEIENFIKTH